MFWEKRKSSEYSETPIEARQLIEKGIYTWVPKEEGRDKLVDLAIASFETTSDMQKTLLLHRVRGHMLTEGNKELLFGLDQLRNSMKHEDRVGLDTLLRAYVQFLEGAHKALDGLKKYTDAVPDLPDPKKLGLSLDGDGNVVEVSLIHMQQLRHLGRDDRGSF